MRDLAQLLDFLRHTMTMMTVYQPAVILHLLTRGGVTSRSQVARMLSGYDEWELQTWDRVLMDNPKRWLVGKHQILTYDSQQQNFSLNFDLSDAAGVAQAAAICDEKITVWIQKALRAERISEAEALRLYRVLEIARCGEQYQPPEPDWQLEEFAMQVALRELHQRFPGEKVTQQPRDLGFDLLVGTVEQPIAYVKVKATAALQPVFFFSEGERRFALDHAAQYGLLLVYAIRLSQEKFEFLYHTGAIVPGKFSLVALQWKAQWLPELAAAQTVDQTVDPVQ
jgi:hypothetical protein